MYNSYIVFIHKNNFIILYLKFSNVVLSLKKNCLCYMPYEMLKYLTVKI